MKKYMKNMKISSVNMKNSLMKIFQPKAAHILSHATNTKNMVTHLSLYIGSPGPDFATLIHS